MTVPSASKTSGRRKALMAAAGFFAFATPFLFAGQQAKQSPAQSPNPNAVAADSVFEVVSIRQNKNGSGMIRFGLWGERFLSTGMTLEGLIQEAFAIENDQLSGEPHWLKSESYDVEAKMDHSVADQLQHLSFDQRLVEYHRMLQMLLADRFKLAFHWETKELPVYALVVVKKGPQINEAKPGDTYPNGIKDLDGQGHGDIVHFGRAS